MGYWLRDIFKSVEDPWRIFLTTDHPNGAPFTSYPHLIRLLMDKSFRNDAFAKLNLDAQSMSNLTSLRSRIRVCMKSPL